MCSHYTALKKQEQLERYFRARGIPLPPKSDMWPRYQGVFVRRPPEHDSGDEAVPAREAVTGRWGLISAMTKADSLDKAGKLSTFNARSESAPKSFTFGNAWRRGQRCIIPAEAIFEPDHISGLCTKSRRSMPLPTDGRACQLRRQGARGCISAIPRPSRHTTKVASISYGFWNVIR